MQNGNLFARVFEGSAKETEMKPTLAQIVSAWQSSELKRSIEMEETKRSELAEETGRSELELSTIEESEFTERSPSIVETERSELEPSAERSPLIVETERSELKPPLESSELEPSTTERSPSIVETEGSELEPSAERSPLIVETERSELKPPLESSELEPSITERSPSIVETEGSELKHSLESSELELSVEETETSQGMDIKQRQEKMQKLKQRLEKLSQWYERLEKQTQKIKQKLENLERPLNVQQWQALKQSLLDSAQSEMKVVHSIDKKQRLEEKFAKLIEKLHSLEKFAELAAQKKNERELKQIKRKNRLAPKLSQQDTILQSLATFLSLYEHGIYPHISARTSGLSSLPDKIWSSKGLDTPSKSNLKSWTENTVQSTNTCDKEACEHKLRLINNNQTNNVHSAGKSSYLTQESESQLSDGSTTRCDVNIDIMSGGIYSGVSSIDRDVCVVRRKTMTDPSPAYRQQFYAKHTWRYEQNDSNAMISWLPMSSQSSIEADESDNDIDTFLPTKRTRKQKNKTDRQLKGKDQIDDSSSEGSHWSIILKRDLKN